MSRIARWFWIVLYACMIEVSGTGRRIELALRRTTVDLDEEQFRELERLALREAEPVQVLVRRAVDRYLAARSDDWGARFDALVARVQERIPDDLTPDDIEADITAARAEVRAERARRRST
jgi:hypothetical protein